MIDGRARRAARRRTRARHGARRDAERGSRRERRANGANDANDGERGAVDGRDAEYYKGFVTEPVAVDLEERDIWTPTINLVTRSAVVLAGLFAAFLWSNGLPPFAG